MSKSEVLKLREVEVDAALELARCTEGLENARDALNLARGELDRASIAYAAAGNAANKAQSALTTREVKAADTKVSREEESDTAR